MIFYGRFQQSMFVCNSHPSAGRWKSISCTRRWFTHWTHARPAPFATRNSLRKNIQCLFEIATTSYNNKAISSSFFFCQHPSTVLQCLLRELASHQGGSWREARGTSARLSHYVDPAGWGWQRFWTPVSNPQWRNLWNGCFVCDFDLSNGLSMIILLLRFT